jgi:hypothetical protein
VFQTTSLKMFTCYLLRPAQYQYQVTPRGAITEGTAPCRSNLS